MTEPVVTAPVVMSEPLDEVFELVEPVTDLPFEPELIVAEPVDETPRPHATADVDEFEAAARLFSFTGETQVQASPTAEAADRPEASHAPRKGERKAHGHKVGHEGKTPVTPAHRRSNVKRVATASFSLAAIGAVGLLAVGMTMPAEAVAAASSSNTQASMQLAGDVSGGGDDAIQAYVAPAASGGADSALNRVSGFTTGTLVEMAGTAGISNVSNKWFTNDPNCSVQWPFAVGVPITYGFGWRPGEFHEGVDFTPGDGAHIQAVADGTVRIAQNNYQGYGTAVVIDHIINGQLISSLYGHMQVNSFQVHVGDKVQVGEYIGRTGDTGRSFGAHTHLQIMVNGVTPIDPLPWLRAHATC